MKKVSFGDLFTWYISDSPGHGILLNITIFVIFLVIPNLIWASLAVNSIWFADNWLFFTLPTIAITLTIWLLTGVKMFKENGKFANWLRSLTNNN